MPSHAWLRSHGIDPRLHNAWTAMRARCNNPNDQAYRRYGGRGIKVCKRWDSYAAFAADMGPHPGSGWTLDREDNNDCYRRGNCRWATRKTQARNRGAYNTCTAAVAAQVRDMYTAGCGRQKDIGAHFGLSQADVSQIVRGIRWAP